METSKNSLDTKLITDVLMVVMLFVTVILFTQYFQEIEDEVTTAVLNSVHDINNSIVETRTGR